MHLRFERDVCGCEGKDFSGVTVDDALHVWKGLVDLIYEREEHRSDDFGQVNQ